jgi:1-deoxy-D-xylulose-5-phosphate reductoisomerase
MRSLLLLGSTGSIGTQTLDLVRGAREHFRIAGLSAGSSWRELAAQAREFRPDVVALLDPEAAERIRGHLPPGTALLAGPEASREIAAEARYDLAVHGIVGSAGVLPSQEVLRRARPLALANKESLVVAGEPLMELARRHEVPILPVDSEHSAIFQCLQGAAVERVRSVWITASGGALRDLPLERLRAVTPEMALEHPNWDMGPRITVGSATLMNKAFEVIEAHHLFGLPPERIGVVIHRQSVVHSMVEFVDGSVLAQLGPPDMRLPIHYALHWPERAPAALRGFDLALFRELTFEAVDPERYPALELGYRCVRAGGDAGALLNAADEVAVGAFLERRIGFDEILPIDETVLEHGDRSVTGVEALLASDARARSLARAEIVARAQATRDRPLAPR